MTDVKASVLTCIPAQWSLPNPLSACQDSLQSLQELLKDMTTHMLWRVVMLHQAKVAAVFKLRMPT